MATQCIFIGLLVGRSTNDLIDWSAGVQHVVVWWAWHGEEQPRIACCHTVTPAQVWSSITTRKVSPRQNDFC